MKASQIPFYMACPMLYWPWLWLQFRRLDRWMADRVAKGERCGVMLHLGPRGTLTMSFVSDNLSDNVSPTFTTLTFESLTWAYYPEWMYSVMRTLVRPITLGNEGPQAILRPDEVSEALLPIP